MAFFLTTLASVSDHHEKPGDNFACAGSIFMFCVIMLFETDKIHPAAPMSFMVISLSWGVFFQPAVLNRCHLTQWLLVIEAFHNFFTIDTHATFSWGQTVYRSVMTM